MSWIQETSTEALGWEPGGCSRTSKKAGVEQSVGKELERPQGKLQPGWEQLTGTE